jgi:hypothetical protein
MKILRRRILKGVPVWLIIAILLSTGIAFAALVWISNQMSGSVTVTQTPITITSGSLTTPAYIGIIYASNFTYQVNSGTPTGYVYIMMLGTFSSAADIMNSNYLRVFPSGVSSALNGVNVAGYPKYTSMGGGMGMLELLYQDTATSSAFNFGNTGGKIEFTFNLNKAVTVNWNMQISSTAS